MKLGSAIFLNIFKELLVALPKRPTRWTKVFTKMEEEEEDFDETNKSSPNLTHHHYMLLINTVRAIKARDKQSSNVKSTQKQPSPHLTN